MLKHPRAEGAASSVTGSTRSELRLPIRDGLHDLLRSILLNEMPGFFEEHGWMISKDRFEALTLWRLEGEILLSPDEKSRLVRNARQIVKHALQKGARGRELGREDMRGGA